MIKKLWQMMQKDSLYKSRTTFYIVQEHGIGQQWTSHGASVARSNETRFMVMGTNTKPLGEMKTKEQIYQTQYATTIVKLLGFYYAAS